MVVCTIHICGCKYFPFIFVKITCIGSIGQLHFDSSISDLRYLASKTNFNDSPFARMVTGLMKVLLFDCSSLFAGDMISHRSRILSNRLTLSCKWIGTLLALCFLKTASGFNGRCRDEVTFPTSNFDVA